MSKKCLVCDAEAVYKIKDTSDFYCENCAQENFADISLLVKVEEEAQQLKNYLTENSDYPNITNPSITAPRAQKREN
ncbi:MAG: hypothetical protein AB1668_02650 [Nanoarchaeota archaeon]